MLGSYKRTDEAKRIVIDVETKDPFLISKGASWAYNFGHITGIGIKVDNEPSEYYPLNHLNGVNYDQGRVKKYLMDIPKDTVVVGHYLQYDLGWLYKTLGWIHKGGKYRCTLLTSQLRQNNLPSFSLDNLCRDLNIGVKLNIGNPNEIWKQPINVVAKYCNQDIELTAKLDDHNWKENQMAACARECQVLPILVQMKAKGIKIDREVLTYVEREIANKYDEEMSKTPSIKNIWANAAVATLFRRLGINFPFTNKGRESFPQWFLESVDHPEVVALAKARKLHKLLNTFCSGIRQHIAEDGCIHPDLFNGRSDDGGTVTGRFSSAHPNVQQIPHRSEEGTLIRSCFMPPSGIWYKFDYSQQEPRLMIHYASKLNLPDIEKWRIRYQNDPNADFYEPIQNMMGISRFDAKTTTLARCYNMGYGKLARMAKISEDKAQQYLISFDRGLPWLVKLKQYVSARAEDKDHRVRTLGNRYLYFTGSTNQDAFNHLIQGSAADQIKESMNQIYEKTGLVPMIQVHDELGYDFTEEMMEQEKGAEIAAIMENAFKLDIPVKVDRTVGKNWKDCG